MDILWPLRPLTTTTDGFMRTYFSSLIPCSFSQRLLLQDLHDSHVCNSLLVAESEEDLWRSETPFHSRQQAPLPSDGEILRSLPRKGVLLPFSHAAPRRDEADSDAGRARRVRTGKDHVDLAVAGLSVSLVKLVSVEK